MLSKNGSWFPFLSANETKVEEFIIVIIIIIIFHVGFLSSAAGVDWGPVRTPNLRHPKLSSV